MPEILGTDLNEVLVGTADDDTLIGLSGYDTLDGGEGSDTYLVNADDYNGRYVNFYNDTGLIGIDTILAATAGINIGIGSGFGIDSGIEVIDGLEGSIIVGDNDAQVWDFSATEIIGISEIRGQGGRDEIRGTVTADTILGDGGHDTIYGDEGSDNIFGGADSDLLHGEDGDDFIHGDDGHDTLYGGSGFDELFGGTGHDQLFGGDGDDFLTGGEGYDLLDGGEGSDTYWVGAENAGFVDDYRDSGLLGKDVIEATGDSVVIGLMNGFGPDSGIEVISGGAFKGVTVGGTDDREIWNFSGTQLLGVTWINAMGGHDEVTGNNDANQIDGGAGHDILNGAGGDDSLYGGEGHDQIFGGLGNDALYGGAGHDYLDGEEGSDYYFFDLDSDGGFDTIKDTGLLGVDILIAIEDNVVIGLHSDFGADNGIEVISGNRLNNITIGGSDLADHWDFSGLRIEFIDGIFAGDGMDVIIGTSKGDVIYGEAGHDQLFGGRGNDELYGGDDSDFLYGEDGNDDLFGGAAHDVLDGGAGNDTLTGGDGYDTFVFSINFGKDTITDFTIGEDMLDFSLFGTGFSLDDLSFKDKKGGTEIKFGKDSIFLDGVDSDDFTDDMFVFFDG